MITYAKPIPPVRARVKEWPEDDRPRERLLTLGPRALSPRELLALLIETGTPPRDGRPGRSALEVAGELINRFAEPEGGPSLRRVMTASIAELCGVAGIGPAKAAKVLAALELGRRAADEARADRARLHTARDVYERMRLELRDLDQEEFHVLLLNTQNELLRDVKVSLGTLDMSLVHARDVFRMAITECASGVVLVHNHPSGEPAPSPDDRTVTAHLSSAGDLVGVPVLDHVIIGEGRYFSFVEEEMMKKLGVAGGGTVSADAGPGPVLPSRSGGRRHAPFC